MDLFTLIIYAWLVFASFLSVYWGFVILFTRNWTKRILTAKLFKKPLAFELLKGGAFELSSTKWNEGTLIDEEGLPIQDFKETEDDKGNKDVRNQYWTYDGVRVLLRPQDGLTCLDNVFKPCEPNQVWLENYIQRQKIRIELGKKFLKKKATNFPLLWIVLIIIIFVVAYLMYILFF